MKVKYFQSLSLESRRSEILRGLTEREYTGVGVTVPSEVS